MTAMLSVLWTITKGAWLTAAVILLIRLLFHRVLTAKAKYYLWLLLALRLVLPVLPESPVSLLNFLPNSSAPAAVQEVQEASDTPDAPELSQPAELSIPAPVQESAAAGAPEVLTAPDAPSLPGAPTSSDTPGSTVSMVLFWVWLGGMGVVLLVQLLLYSLTARQLRRLPFCTDSDTLRVFLSLKRACGVKGEVRLVSGGAGMLGGLMHPTIVPPVERHGEDVAPIILHELQHYKYGDLWISALFRLLCAVYWFNPAVWLCFRWAEADSEAACDQRVLETKLVRADCYAGVLYEEGMLRMKKGLLPQTTFGGRRHSLKRRIRLIATFRSPKVWATVLAVVLALGITACTMTGATSDAGSQAALPDFETYMQDYEPPGGSFGMTFDEHVAQGLLDPDTGTMNHFTRSDCDLTYSIFTTSMELGGETVEVGYSFSQTVLSDAEILTQVFVTPPEGTPIGTWLDDISDPWLSAMTQNTDLNGWEWNTQEYVADFLTEAQLDTAIHALVTAGQNSTSPEFPTSEDNAEWSLKATWRVVTAFYTGDKNLWQFNGTGAAMIAAANRMEADADPNLNTTAGSAVPVSSTPTLDSTISPYVLSDGGISYDGISWDMIPLEVLASQTTDTKNWTQSTEGRPVLHSTSPLPDHPEVTDIYCRYAFVQPELTMRLFRVETHYDPAIISYEDLVAQRTRELGEPNSDYTAGALWHVGEMELVIYPDRDGRTQEWLSLWHDQFDMSLMPECDIDGYIEGVQPPIGHFGWTFEEHVAAGLLDPDNGVLEPGDAEETFYLFTTQVELGGYALDATYVFIETLAAPGSGREILSEINVEIPTDIPLSQWVARFSEPWCNRMLQDGNTWRAPFPVGSLLTETQREVIAENLLAGGHAATLEEAYAYLDNWSFAGNFYDAKRGWVFNGTGLALYTAVQSIE